MSTPESKPERERESSGRFVGGMVTPEQAADLLSCSRAGESQRALAAEVGCAPSYMHTILKRAAEAEARANAPVPVGVQRTVRQALEAIINDANARHTDIVAAARALDALKREVLDGQTPGRPSTIVLAGPVVCPHCGESLREARKSELADALAAMSAEADNGTASEDQDIKPELEVEPADFKAELEIVVDEPGF